jgi:hypothetical protein
MWYPHHGLSWETMVFGGLMMVLFWGSLIALVVWLFRANVGPNTSNSRNDAPARAKPVHHRHDGLGTLTNCAVFTRKSKQYRFVLPKILAA